MAKKNYNKTKKKIKDEQPETLNKTELVTDTEEAETRRKIEEVLAAKGDELEHVAEELDPDFERDDYVESYDREIREFSWDKPVPAAEVSPSVYPKSASERYQPRTGLGRFFLKDRHSIAFGAMLLMMAFAVAFQGLDYYITETVNVTYKTMKGTDELKYETRAKTVGEFVEEIKADGLEISDSDAVDWADDKLICDDMKVVIARTVKSKAKIEGTTTDFMLIPGTVKENLEFNGVTYDKDDEIAPALDKNVKSSTRIKVDEVHYVTKEKTEKVEAESKVILDPSLTSGVQQTKEGNDGKGVFTYKYKYVNGKKVKTDKKVKKWIKKPHNHELRLGTSATGNSGTFIVARTFIANTTAYTARPGARGSLGEAVHVGTCAVDPSFVSYRSQMWIEGYGYAYANDCGGAVKGNVVDLYMNSTGACIQWGRRNVTAYVLVPAN